MLVDHARPERLGELVRTLLPLAPELEVHTKPHRLVEARAGSTLVLVPRAEDADWLNLNRPLFASNALRVVLFCTREVSVALSRGAVDFLDWMSLRLECPPGPVPHAVAGLRCALAARVPGISWTAGDLEASFAAARPRRVLRRVSAARPYEELVAEAKAGGHGDWLAWTEVDGEFRLRRVRWALAEARRRTRTLLVEPAVRSPGWWEVHGRMAGLGEARERLRQAGAQYPGRLAALVDLEPEAVELLCGLLERGHGEQTLTDEILEGADPGAAVGRLATAQGLVTEKALARGTAPPPAMRAFAVERDRRRRLHGAELDAIAQRLSEGEQVDAEDAAWWSAWTRAISSPKQVEGLGQRGEGAEVVLRHAPRTGATWALSTSMAVATGDMEVAHLWAQHTNEAEPAKWGELVEVLRRQKRFAEAEAILRRQLEVNAHMPDVERGWILHELGYVLHLQGRNAEAEELLRPSLTIDEQVIGPHHRDYAASLHLLANVLAEQGRYTEAEKLLRQSLVIKEQALGPQHPGYALSLHDLAEVLEAQGQYTEAEKLLRQSLASTEQALGPQHLNYATSLHELAWVLERQGRYADAEEALLRSLTIKKQALGPDHPTYAASLHDLAGVRLRQARYAEAEELLRQSLAITLRARGSQHPSYGASLHDLARVLQRQGRHAEAEQLLRQSLTIKDKARGTQDPGYAKSLHQLALALEAQGRYAEAEQLLRQSLAINEQALGPRHPQLAATLAALGSLMARQQQPQEGELLLLRSVDIARETLGPRNPETAQVLSMLAQVQATLKRPEAATTAQQAMDALLHSLGPNHPITKGDLPVLRHIQAGEG